MFLIYSICSIIIRKKNSIHSSVLPVCKLLCWQVDGRWINLIYHFVIKYNTHLQGLQHFRKISELLSAIVFSSNAYEYLFKYWQITLIQMRSDECWRLLLSLLSAFFTFTACVLQSPLSSHVFYILYVDFLFQFIRFCMNKNFPNMSSCFPCIVGPCCKW